MNEFDFRQRLYGWSIDVTSALVPTSAEIRLYGQESKTKIIPEEHEHLIYDCIKPLEISDELYKKLSENMKMTDPQILRFVHKTYCQNLKDIRKSILKLQKEWSRNYAHFRAKQLMKNLEYEDVYHICDLDNQRIVPIELILKIIFDISSKYGDHRRIKNKSEIYVDPRVMQAYEDIKKHKLYVEDFYRKKAERLKVTENNQASI